MKKIISLIICIAMSLCFFAGCDESTQSKNDEKSEKGAKEKQQSVKALTDEEIIVKSLEAFDKVDSVHIVAQTENAVSAMGRSVVSKIKMMSDADIKNGTQYLKAEMEQDGITNVSESYIKVAGDNAGVYISSNGQWMKQTTGFDENIAREYGLHVSSYNESMTMYLENLKLNSTKTEKNVEGKDCYVFNAKIDGSQIEMLENTELKDVLDSITELGMTNEQLNEILASMEKINYEIAIEKETYLPVKIDIEMKDAMNSLMGAAMKQQGSGMTFSVEKCVSTATYTQYNSIPAIVIPPSALDGTEISTYN